MDDKTTDSNVIREYFEALSTPQVEKQIEDFKQERDAYLTQSNDYRVLADGITRKIEIGVSVIGVRNYENAIDTFKPTADHIRLLAEYGNDPKFGGASDHEVASFLGWEVGDSLTGEQEQNIATLAHELKLAQSFINRRALSAIK